MSSVSGQRPANARKTGASLQAAVLQQLAHVTQDHAATCMGISASTLSRFVSDGSLERACHLIAALHLQLATADSVVVDPDELRFLKRMAVKYLDADLARQQDVRNHCAAAPFSSQKGESSCHA